MGRNMQNHENMQNLYKTYKKCANNCTQNKKSSIAVQKIAQSVSEAYETFCISVAGAGLGPGLGATSGDQ